MRPRLYMLALLLLSPPLLAQDRDTKVRNDRKAFGSSRDWIYNDLAEGVRAAKASNKPLLVVFRCIPCEACQEFDDDVARRDPIIRDLLDEFVCVRIVQANTIDLTRFQHDFDQSFAAYLMNPDLTIYGRFGTRSGRPEHEDISLEGLRKAMEAALRMHRDYGAVQAVPGRQAGQAGPLQDAEGLPEPLGQVRGGDRLRGQDGEELHALPPDPGGRAAGVPHGEGADPRRGALPVPRPGRARPGDGPGGDGDGRAGHARHARRAGRAEGR